MESLLRSFLLVFLCFITAQSLSAQNVKDLISQGDKLATQEFKNEEALKKFLEADKLSPNNWEILWRISRSYVDITEHKNESEDEMLSKYKLAYDYANRAVKLAPDKSVTYLRRAIANGRIALYKGVFSVIGIVNDVKADAEKAIQLGNGGNEVVASAHYVLARTHAKVCEKAYLVRLPLGLGWGDMDVAIENFKKAISLRGNFRMFHLDLAKAYIEEDEYAKAREHLNKIPNLPVLDEDDYMFAQEAQKLLKEIKDK